MYAVGVSVGVAHGYVDLVVIVLQLELKAESVIVYRCFLRHIFARDALIITHFTSRLIISVIGNIVATSIPAEFICCRLLSRIEDRHHTIVELTIWLHKVYNVENVFAKLPCVLYFEVEPLGIIPCPIIRLEYQLILVAVHLNHLLQISRFKPRLKQQHIVLSWRCTVDWLVRLVPRVETAEVAILTHALIFDSTMKAFGLSKLYLIFRIKIINLIFVVGTFLVDFKNSFGKINKSPTLANTVVLLQAAAQHELNFVLSLELGSISDVLRWIK